MNAFDWNDNHVTVSLKNEYKKKGSVFVYLPEREALNKVRVTANGKPGKFDVVARPTIGGYSGRVLRAYIEIDGSGAKGDGLISLKW